jgi:hypothetical protein
MATGRHKATGVRRFSSGLPALLRACVSMPGVTQRSPAAAVMPEGGLRYGAAVSKRSAGSAGAYRLRKNPRTVWSPDE